MEWVHQSPQIYNIFGDLGYAIPDGYHISENCKSALETILRKLITDDKYYRTFRRSISLGQHVKKDLIPLLINTKDDATIELLIKILVNLTVPVECLLSIESLSRTDIGRHSIFDINNMLSLTKIAFTDQRVTKVIIDFLKKNAENEQKEKLSIVQCTNINNILLFLRNILHIPEDNDCRSPTYCGPPHTIQNQLLWNIFSNSVDKILIKLMTFPDAVNWGVTIVQLTALFYKDQHVCTLHKLLNLWLETSLSDSSEDNESNTSPPKRGSNDSSPVLTSNPTSDSSDTGASGKCNGKPNPVNNSRDSSKNNENKKQNPQPQPMLTSNPTSDSSDTGDSGKCNGEPNPANNSWDSNENKEHNFQSAPMLTSNLTLDLSHTGNYPKCSGEDSANNSWDSKNNENKEHNFQSAPMLTSNLTLDLSHTGNYPKCSGEDSANNSWDSKNNENKEHNFQPVPMLTSNLTLDLSHTGNYPKCSGEDSANNSWDSKNNENKEHKFQPAPMLTSNLTLDLSYTGNSAKFSGEDSANNSWDSSKNNENKEHNFQPAPMLTSNLTLDLSYTGNSAKCSGEDSANNSWVSSRNNENKNQYIQPQPMLTSNLTLDLSYTGNSAKCSGEDSANNSWVSSRNNENKNQYIQPQPMLTSNLTLDLSYTGNSAKCSGEDSANNSWVSSRNNENKNQNLQPQPMLTSNSTSALSDTGYSGKSNGGQNPVNNSWDSSKFIENKEYNIQLPPMLTTNLTSDSSDTGDIRKCSGEQDSGNNSCFSSKNENKKQHLQSQNTNNGLNDSFEDNRINPIDNDEKSSKKENNDAAKTTDSAKSDEKEKVKDNSDCGYGTQIENQESINTSSNEDELPAKKKVHQKPHTSKQRTNPKVRTTVSLQERKRKKIVKRVKANITNVQGLSHKTPNDEDISNVIKEFTVDFLLKGYNSLVQSVHTQILTNTHLEIDTSHFFWLVTYFLKFATQIELDLEHVRCVLCFEIVSYLTAEGVNLCEQFELALKLDGNDLKLHIRRLHLVVTAIREFVQAIEMYKKAGNSCNNDTDQLDILQVKMSESNELRMLLVLLLRSYNAKYHTKQYLQDLVVTNHIVLLFMESKMKLPDYKGTTMTDHIKEFRTPKMMYHYGLTLEDYEKNGAYVNDSIFTMMHHVGGDEDSLYTLYQPVILKTFISIRKSDYEICDDWTDLIEYVLNTFFKKSNLSKRTSRLHLNPELNADCTRMKKLLVSSEHGDEFKPQKRKDKKSEKPNNSNGWTEDELTTLNWNYMQCKDLSDVVGEIMKMFKEDGIVKTRESVVKELYHQFIINKEQYDKFSKKGSSKTAQATRETRDEIGKLCQQLVHDGKSVFLDWVQRVILETCQAKLYLNKKLADTSSCQSSYFFLQKPNDLPVMSAVSYHSLILNSSIPLVPWNCQQAAICKDLKFLQLLHKLGFHMPVDTGKVFIRIPHFWTPDIMYEVAAKISPIDTSKLKFSLDEISESSVQNSAQTSNFILPELSKGLALSPIPESFYHIHNSNHNHLASIVNFTPMPGSSFTTADDNVNFAPCWLDVVQKSKEYKISLDLGNSISAESEDMAVDEQMHVSMKTIPRAPVTPMGPVTLMMSSIMSTKLEPSNFVEIPEPDFCSTSVCDTDSVASDLTRMYVSDEDESEPVRIAERKQRAARRAAVTLPDDLDAHHLDIMGGCVAGKRPRIHFPPPF